MLDEPITPQPVSPSAPPEPEHNYVADVAATVGTGGPSRMDDISNAAMAGQKRAEREVAIHQKLKEKKLEEERKSKQLLAEDNRAKAEGKQKKKGYRTMIKTREKALAEDKARREKEAKAAAEEQKEREAKRKEEQGYMKELHDVAALKQGMKNRENAAKRKQESEQHKAEAEHRRKIEDANQAERARFDQIDREAYAQKAVIDGETRSKLYQLEASARSKQHELESNMNNELSMVKIGAPADVQRLQADIQARMRNQKRFAYNEVADKNAAIMTEDRSKKESVRVGIQQKRGEATIAKQNAIHAADRWLSNRMNDIDRTFREETSGIHH